MPSKILIVDDDTDTLRLVGLVLERQGYQILAASDGQRALDLARSELPDLILLDIMMPGLDGYAVARQLRADERTTQIPFIMFTARSQVEDKLQGFEVGADDYLIKPTQPRELVARVKAVLARSARGTAPAASRPRGERLAILAPKGGLGVTTLALNLAVAIRKETGQEVILADFRPGQGSLSLELAVEESAGFTDLLQRQAAEISLAEIEKRLIEHDSGIRLLLSSVEPRDAQYASAASQFEAIAQLLPALARYAILDLGPGLPSASESVIRHCERILVVLEPVPQTVRQGKTLIQHLTADGKGRHQIHAVLVNRFRSGAQLTWSQVQEQLGHPVTNLATPDPELAYLASRRNVPMILHQPDGQVADQFARLAAQVIQRSR
jgi:DNA-binding response OmpR family regulator